MDRPLELWPEEGVAWEDGRWLAHSADAWLRAPGLEHMRGGWMRLRYHAGLFDEPVRPLIRFALADGGEVVVPMNGAPLGVGQWCGRVPDHTIAVSISPVRRAGPFSFALVNVARMSRFALLFAGLRSHPKLALTACGARVIGARTEAHHCLAFAGLGTPFKAYARWLAERSRPVDLAGFDRPRTAWGSAPCVHVVISRAGDEAALDRTLAAVRAQSYPHVRLSLLSSASASLADLGAASNDLVVLLSAGEILHPHALAWVMDLMEADRNLAACYGDEDGMDSQGLPKAPRFKPDPAGIAAMPETTACETLFWRVADAPGRFDELSAGTVPLGRLGHVRRLLLRRSPPTTIAEPSTKAAAAVPVTVVIPTRDRAGLLSACLHGLAQAGCGPVPDIVIVDNGSTDPAALAVIAEAAHRPEVRIIRAPGPFNFSALCNAGADQATTPFLLFLNNDVVATEPDWIARLSAWAIQPDVGAVGARLVYPDGRLQHGGVVIGMGGTALHVHHRARVTDGYLGQLARAHRVGAVTGAVLMVERRKFVEVGGFDAEHFPVLLNDVDLCLRLSARGWHTVYEPAATLMHAESASRGRSARPFTLYRKERRAFAERWRDAIRDDPCFHPALSLTSLDPALG